ncbi:sulfotransferase [Porticoccus sp. GXU_MW_L64]
MEKKAKNIIILGMPRSGTSMLSSIFVNHGYYVASDSDSVRAPDHFNPDGYWESDQLTKFNAEVLKISGFQHDNTWMYDSILSDHIKNIKNIKKKAHHKNFVEFYYKNAPWVWKDPRLCYTLEYWWPLVAENTKVILIERDRKAIFNSFVRVRWKKKSRKDRDDAYKRIRNHIGQAVKTLQEYDIPHLRLRYEDFQNHPELVLREISEFSNVEITQSVYKKEYDHSDIKGRVSTVLDSFVSKLPSAYIKRIKKVMPGWLLKKMYPERNKR